MRCEDFFTADQMLHLLGASLPVPGIVASRARGRRDRPAAAEAVPRAPRGRKIAPRHRRNILHIPTSGLYARKGKPGRVAAARRRSSDAALCRLHHRRTLVPRCPMTSPRWPRRPFIRTKASTKRENAVPTPSASNEGQVFKGGESSAADGEQHTGRAARAEGWCERYRGPPDHQTRRSECYRPTLVDELWSAVISQQTLVAFMTCAGMEESSVEPVTIAVS